jgi:hypothetical protein
MCEWRKYWQYNEPGLLEKGCCPHSGQQTIIREYKTESGVPMQRVECPSCGSVWDRWRDATGGIHLMPRTLSTEDARSAAASRKTHGGGRPRSKQPRCACGAMTLRRAIARSHKCERKTNE